MAFSRIVFKSLSFVLVTGFGMPDPDSENNRKIPIFVENKLFTTAFAFE
jgi:hypothetical protein